MSAWLETARSIVAPFDIEDWLDEQAIGAKCAAPEDLSRLTSAELVDLMPKAMRLYAISGGRDELFDQIERLLEKRRALAAEMEEAGWL